MTPYLDNTEYLRDELTRLNERLRRAVGESAGGDVGAVGAVPLVAAASAPGDAPTAAEIDARVMASLAGGGDLRLPRIAALFSLTSFETDVLLLALAPEIDLGYERVFAQLQGDPNPCRATVDLAMRLACTGVTERVLARRAFADQATLLRAGLLTLVDPPHRRGSPLSALWMALDRATVSFLLADPGVPCDEAPDGDSVDAALIYPPATMDEIRAVAGVFVGGARPAVCIVEGETDHGVAAAAVARAAGLRLHRVTAATLARDTGESKPTCRAPFRDAVLRGSALYLEGLDQLAAESASQELFCAAFAEAARHFACHVFVSTTAARSVPAFQGRRRITLRLPPPDAVARRSVWRHYLSNGHGPPQDTDLSHVCSAFRFTPSQIALASNEARSRAALRDGPGAEPGGRDVLAACRSVAGAKSAALATRVTPGRGWDQLVLPADSTAQLHEFVQQVRHRLRVMHDWGFGRLGSGQGIVALFAGPSGTGKTLAAEVVAGDLGLDLYRVDLSAVVSKYIGETEKNLDRVFSDAHEAGALLFFDECDALFGKRSDVKDAHDRYANLETGFLLQRLEQHEGAVVLATNFRSNVDDAFTRRLSFAVEFPFPGEAQRLALWKGMFPAQSPLGDDVDFAFLARQFRLAGGNIRNAALAAAYLAAGDGQQITMPHVVRSLKREYQKLGRPCERNDFGAYYDWVR